MDHALSNFLAFGQPTKSVQSAAIQAIFWEIMYEQAGNPYGFGTGTFRATSSDAATQTVLNNINWAALPVTPITDHANQLYSREHADFLVLLTPVPEPATLAMLGLGLAGLAATRRRMG